MNRFITYLYDYESGTKGKGTGFIRVDTRGREVRMEVHVRNVNQFQGKGKIYLITNNDKVIGIYAGEITILEGKGDETFRFSYSNMFHSGKDFSNVVGVVIRYNDGYLASNWQEKNCPELLKGTFEVLALQRTEESQEEKVMKTELRDLEEVKQVEAESKDLEEVKQIEVESKDLEEVKQVEAGPIEAQRMEQVVEAVTTSQLKETEMPMYRKIQLAHIHNLPPRNRYLCNNSFVLHGFFNYHYLLLKIEKTNNGEKWSLGVPGVYEGPEKMMAMMFGFSEFEAQERDKENQEPKEGTFGAWFMTLEK